MSSGAPFWSTPRQFPKPLQFSSSDLSHMALLTTGFILRSTTFGIPISDWASNVKLLAHVVDELDVPKFNPKQGVKIVTDENYTNMNASTIDDTIVIDNLIKTLEDDTNYHMDLIAIFSYMHVRNYSIPEVDKLKVKFIARRIVPSLVMDLEVHQLEAFSKA